MTKKIRCLLVDDEPPALEILRVYIGSTPMLEIAGECPHAIAAFEFVQQHSVDLIFLDVNMPTLSGIDFLKALPTPPKVIITTAHKDFAVDGFELGIIDYLLKPFSLDRFLRAVHRALQIDYKGSKTEFVATFSERFIYVRAERKMIKIVLNNLLYVEGLKDYVRIFLTSEQVITKQKISALEAILPEKDFLRIHRSFIANVSKISSFNQTSVFIGKTELPIGPLYRHLIMKKLNISNR